MKNNEHKLPLFIDEYIFGKIGAKYAPNFEKFNKNLAHDKEDVLTYLGTYFPRSFSEFYLIFENLFSNKKVYNSYKKQKDINILDIGSGTGGNLSGLLYSFISEFGKDYDFNIFVVDGNKEALEILEKIVNKFKLKYNLRMSLIKKYINFSSIYDLSQAMKNDFDDKFDFIISSKMINEIIKEDTNAYYDFYDNFAKELKEKGLLVLTDVTTKIENEYLPVILNKQTNKFISNYNKDYKTLLPTPCSFHELNCSYACFTNQHLYSTHSKKKQDLSKIVYRIIGRIDFVKDILLDIEVANVVGQTEYGYKYCQCIINQDIKKDGFEI